LLRQPFNLRLGAALLSDGIPLDELSPLRTQVELLDRYWDRRVGGEGPGRFDRQATARVICQTMVERQALQLPTADVESRCPSEALHQLLSQGVLTYSRRASASTAEDWLAYSHHILFDYATARTLLRGEAGVLARRFQDAPHLVLLIRPSLSLHFRHLWLDNSGRRAFWSAALRLLWTEGVPRVGQIVGPSVAAETARSMTDFEPLFDALEAPSQEHHAAAEQAVGHVVGALLASGGALVGTNAGPWCEWVARVAHHLAPTTAGPVRAMLGHWMDRIPEMTDEQRRSVGAAGCRLLDYAERTPAARHWLYHVAIATVCRTFSANPHESARVLGKLLAPGALTADRLEALGWLAHEVKALALQSPDLAEQLYIAVFRAGEVPDEQVPVISSQLMGLHTSARDKFKMAERGLADSFTDFLQTAPEHALRALAVALQEYPRQHRVYRGEPRVWSFPFSDRRASFISDASCFWDEGSTSQYDVPVQMLDRLQAHLERLASSPATAADLAALVNLVVQTQSLAVVWRRLLSLGAAHPDTAGPLLLPLVEVDIVLLTPDTCTWAGRFLQAVFPHLDEPSRQRIEGIIMRLPESPLLGELYTDEASERGQRMRDRLLGRLPLQALVTEAARQRLEETLSVGRVPHNEPAFCNEGWVGVTEQEHWERRGIPFDVPVSVRYRELAQPVAEFTAKFRDGIPDVTEVLRIEAALRELSAELAAAATNGLHPELVSEGTGEIAACSAAILRNGQIFGRSETLELLRRLLMSASSHPQPVHSPQDNEQFDQTPALGIPAPRLQAAQGLMLLARDPRGATPEVLAAVERLSRDPVHAVRFAVARQLYLLNRVDPGLMWRLIEQFAAEDPSPPVLFALAADTLDQLLRAAREAADRVVGLIEQLRARVAGKVSNRTHDARTACVRLLLGAYLHLNHPSARELLHSIAAEPDSHVDELRYLAGCLRDFLDERQEIRSPSPADEVRDRGWTLLNVVSESAVQSFQSLVQTYGKVTSAEVPGSAQEAYKSLSGLLDTVALNLYLASGADDDRKDRGQGKGPHPLAAGRQRFLSRALRTIGDLGVVGLAPVAHHLVELLQSYIDVDPKRVFLEIGRAVEKSLEGGYQYESLAADLIVRVVERYLADYRDVLREDARCQELLMKVLDAFVGWTEARKLAYRLEEVFR
jgi:hypothetical protein